MTGHARSRNLDEPGHKRSIYFPEHIIGDVVHEAKRLDRSISWIVQRCVVSGGLAAVQSLRSDEAGDE